VDPAESSDAIPGFLRGLREERHRVEFDEAAWPCVPIYRRTFEAACQRGQERMAGSRAVLCGLARDAERELPLNLARLSHLGGLFADHRIVVHENDSCDQTPKLLSEAARRDPRLQVISETHGTPRWPSIRDLTRAAALARCRNRVHEAVTQSFGDFDYVIVADLDLEGWSYLGLANALGLDDWDAMASTGIRFQGARPFFCDGWAFRGPGQREAARPRGVRPMLFPRGTPPIPIDSGFSGLAVYSMAAFAAGRYGGSDCEHVVFHAALASAGFDRIFLNPSMLSLYPDFAEGEA